ncbi:MAG TPA: Yip1 family protein [Candidatus Kapabacteria bacterium]
MALVDRAKNIIMSPKTEWAVIAAEEPNSGSMVTGYALPLILLSAVASFIGYGLIGYDLLGVKIGGINWGLHHALMAIVMGILSIYITSFVVDALAPSFGSQKNSGRAMQLVIYSCTPMWVGGLLQVLPMIGWIGSLFGLYSIYLIYLGLPHTMKTPQDKVAIYMIVTLVVLIVVYMLVGMVLGGIMMTVFGLSNPAASINL